MRVRTISCPACGGDLPLRSMATAVAECAYCRNTLVINSAAIENIGKMSLIAETDSCLSIGWPAICLGRSITTLGRLQFKCSAGLWDEWWIRFDDSGETAFISQDENEYMLEHQVKANIRIPGFGACSVGRPIIIEGRTYIVEEKNHATMVGVQGELPFPIEPNETMAYVDLAGDNDKGTISYFNDRSVELYIGRYLEWHDLQPVFEDGGPA